MTITTSGNKGRCPKCEAQIQSVELEDINVTVNAQPRWVGSSYICPRCKTVLSVCVNPLLLKDDTVAALKKG